MTARKPRKKRPTVEGRVYAERVVKEYHQLLEASQDPERVQRAYQIGLTLGSLTRHYETT